MAGVGQTEAQAKLGSVRVYTSDFRPMKNVLAGATSVHSTRWCATATPTGGQAAHDRPRRARNRIRRPPSR
jgi:hypothetical protein